MPTQSENIRVLVTGATGFIGQHVILQLLQKGYSVRGTMRSLAKADAVRETLAAHTDAVDRLEFAELDLTSDAGWAEAMEGVTYVQHIASPFPIAEPKDPDELVIPARDGALRALRFARDAGVRRVVLTSSYAAIGYGHPLGRHTSFDETLWSAQEMVEDHTAYTLSKTVAERAAWDFLATEGGTMELSVVNPVLVLGPMLGRDDSSSLEVIRRIMAGEIPGFPEIGFGIVDVRDVASLHVTAMERAEAAGERFLAIADYKSFREMGDIIREALPDAAGKIPTRTLPSWLVRAMALVMPSVRPIAKELGRRRDGSNAKARNTFDWAPRPGREAVIAAAQSLTEKGFV